MPSITALMKLHYHLQCIRTPFSSHLFSICQFLIFDNSCSKWDKMIQQCTICFLLWDKISLRWLASNSWAQMILPPQPKWGLQANAVGITVGSVFAPWWLMILRPFHKPIGRLHLSFIGESIKIIWPFLFCCWWWFFFFFFFF